jgi:hypothetical protein
MNIENITRTITNNDETFSWYEGDEKHTVSFGDVRDDLFKMLDATTEDRVTDLLESLYAGEVDGDLIPWDEFSSVEDPELHERGLTKLWFRHINLGDLPQFYSIARLTTEWIELWDVTNLLKEARNKQ